MKRILEIKKFYSLVLFICIISLISAVYIEYIMEQKPCKLCIYQRLPYLFAIFICFFGYNFYKNFLWIYLLIITFFISTILSGYHVGIENNIFSEFSGCTDLNINLIDKTKILESLNMIPPSCKEVNFNIFGLSLATINLFISIFISLYTVKLIKNEKNRSN